MNVGHYVACFFGGMFLMNAIPHAVAGAMGRAFQSPFAKPPGEGLSSSTVNMAWGMLNLVAAWLLLVLATHFDIRAWDDAVALGLGALAIGIHLSIHFGRFHGGNSPQ